MLSISTFQEYRRQAQGETCNGQLEQIYHAKEQIAFKISVRVGGYFFTVRTEDIDVYLRGFSLAKGDNICPSGGTYDWAELFNTTTGMTIVPQCSWRFQPYRTSTNSTCEELGWHIHRRFYTESAYGIYARNPEVSFCEPTPAPAP